MNNDNKTTRELAIGWFNSKASLEKTRLCDTNTETMGNENSNGNALYLIVMQWAEQKK